MKVLSLLQPWASLVVMGHKLIETRSFNTKHRGPLLIHASARKIKYDDYKRMMGTFIQVLPFDVLEKHGKELQVPTLGAIIGSVNLAGTSLLQVEGKDLPTGYVSADTGESWKLTDQEKAFGHYAPKRYGWLLKDPIMFPNPIPCKGDLGIRDMLRPSAFAIVKEKEPYEKAELGRPKQWYFTYYGQRVDGSHWKETAESQLQTILDNFKYYRGDRSRMPGASYWWPRILEIEQQLFNPGVASIDQMTASMNC